MGVFPEEVLRNKPIGVWNYMREPEEPDWSKAVPTDYAGAQSRYLGKGRISLPDVSWRVSTRHELVSYFEKIMKTTYKHLAITLISLIGALYSLSLYLASRDLMLAGFAVVFAALTSRHYTKAWGNYTGGWTDYEHDPVQVIPHNAYVLTDGKRLR